MVNHASFTAHQLLLLQIHPVWTYSTRIPIPELVSSFKEIIIFLRDGLQKEMFLLSLLI